MSSFGLIEKNMELSHIYLAVPGFELGANYFGIPRNHNWVTQVLAVQLSLLECLVLNKKGQRFMKTDKKKVVGLLDQGQLKA